MKLTWNEKTTPEDLIEDIVVEIDRRVAHIQAEIDGPVSRQTEQVLRARISELLKFAEFFGSDNIVPMKKSAVVFAKRPRRL